MPRKEDVASLAVQFQTAFWKLATRLNEPSDIEPKRVSHLLQKSRTNVNPGLINPWLINRGVSPFSGDSSLLEGTPPKNGTGLLILGQHYGKSALEIHTLLKSTDPLTKTHFRLPPSKSKLAANMVFPKSTIQ